MVRAELEFYEGAVRLGEDADAVGGDNVRDIEKSNGSRVSIARRCCCGFCG